MGRSSNDELYEILDGWCRIARDTRGSTLCLEDLIRTITCESVIRTGKNDTDEAYQVFKDLLETTNIDGERIVSLKPFTELLYHAQQKMLCFAVSQNANFLFVPQEAGQNDLVCVLYGCSIPVVLRPRSGGFYSFVGQCYALGFMRGEAIEGLRNGKYKSEEFELQ
ncbi:uncharacterized protein K452DRAFT_309523 [Aplosporella prunicola CBS 121167]|uniref:Uncharacterized protein n=1 Tax=Aplosporella prunicola CBS 121167 TaxID=1176127 RepID=A0A6A6BAH3_9PEZI|nr:uncharacterized protein K452DRAFT_309523 [Aplosporella prunicola CBS 121167]KAF2141090.1 hypothetical protein K452DRAFT_309523 [Aplosporella prunicola CBS 121167]